MRRRARANPLTRRQVKTLLRQLSVSSTGAWPTHLAMAHKILADQSGIPDEILRSIIAAAVSAAYVCAKAINQRVGNVVGFQTRNKLREAFERISKCAKRAPAELRRDLDAAVAPLIQQECIDLEVIETIFDAALEVFSKYSRHEAARTGLAVLMYQPPGGEQYATVKNDFPGLSAEDQIKAKRALMVLGRASKKTRTTASDAFATLATALKCKQSAKLNSQIHTLIVDYVAAVADLWRRSGLRPSRARHPADPSYKSKFHRFVDLVLTEMVEPWARRYDGSLDSVRRQTRLAHEKLRPEFRSIVSPALRGADVEWLVSDDHLKKALRRRSKNRL